MHFPLSKSSEERIIKLLKQTYPDMQSWDEKTIAAWLVKFLQGMFSDLRMLLDLWAKDEQYAKLNGDFSAAQAIFFCRCQPPHPEGWSL